MSESSKRLEKASKYLQKGNIQFALTEYTRVLEEDPSNETASVAIADLQVQLGRRSEAQVVLRRLLERQLASGNQAAATTWNKLCRLSRPAPEMALRIAQFFQNSDQKLALESARSAAPALLQAARKKDALACYELLQALEPNRDHLRRMADLSAELGDQSGAAERYLRLGTEDPDAKDAFECLYLARELDPSSEKIAVAYAKAALQSKREANILPCVAILEPFGAQEQDGEEARQVLGDVLMALGHFAKAAPFVLETFEKSSQGKDAIAQILRHLLYAGEDLAAIEIASRFESASFKAGRGRDCVQELRQLAEIRPPRMAFLEHLAEVFKTASYEQDYSVTLLQLYELHFAAGNFLKAADYLELAVDLDAYEPGHNRRLEMLRGKIPAKRFDTIGSRFGVVHASEAPVASMQESVAPDENTVLEDLILQAEFFLQYKVPARAVERLNRISKLFPGEEANNPRLRELYSQAGISSQTTPPDSQPTGLVPSPDQTSRLLKGSTSVNGTRSTPMLPQAASAAPSPVLDAASLDRLSEISRNIQRQGTVKAVLFSSVNDIGRHWEVGRCIGLMTTHSAPPSIAVEYCAPGLKPSEIKDIVKLVGMLQPIVTVDGPIVIPSPESPRKHAPLRTFAAGLGIASLLAIPLLDGDQQVGLLILADSHERELPPAEIELLKTLCRQMALAVSNARLRRLVRDLSIAEEKSGLLKRASYIDVLVAEVRRSQEQRSACCVLMLDVKSDYDSARASGERKAEALMQHIGQVVSSHIRQNDVAIRYDMSTIALVLADTTEQGGVLAGEKLRQVLSSMPMPGSEIAPRATAAVVEAVVRRGYDPVDIVTELINRAEVALQSARSSGPTTYSLASPWKISHPVTH